ncbi:MAG: hypothetical protein ACRDF0_07190, partial [Candidatus Limnocylindria bacterium]
MRRYLRHRYALAIPFVLLAAVTVVGGLLNSVDARGRVVDDFTDTGVADATITHGSRRTLTDRQGEFFLEDLPRTSIFRIDASGYRRTSAPTTANEIRLAPLSFTLQVNEEGAEGTRVPNPEVRQGDRLLASGSASGSVVVSPHPGKDVTLLVCAEGYAPREVRATGVLQTVTLAKGGS